MPSRVKEKKERALNTKLFLKAERCNSPKCVMVRRPYRPGVHGRKRRSLSEYGRQLQEKQKIQLIYGLNNRQTRNLFKGHPAKKILGILERRLDRIVFLLGLALSMRIARQLVTHGHILVNERKTTFPAYKIRVGDVIAVAPGSRKIKLFEDAALKLKKQEAPEGFQIDKENWQAKCVSPFKEDEAIRLPFDIDLVVQFYSR